MTVKHKASDQAQIRQLIDRWAESLRSKNVNAVMSHYAPDIERTDDEKTDVWVRATFCCRKIDGKWKIVHEHQSVPFYMDGSYRAALDLTP